MNLMSNTAASNPMGAVLLIRFMLHANTRLPFPPLYDLCCCYHAQLHLKDIYDWWEGRVHMRDMWQSTIMMSGELCVMITGT